MQNYDVLVISISKPILVGIYKNDKLIKTIKKDGKTSDVLPEIFKNIIENYKLNNIIYVNGPGSYMAIKVAYIFLKTICITKEINFYACSGFELNQNSPIKALGKKYFVINDEKEIQIRLLNENENIIEFNLAKNLSKVLYLNHTLPNYQLPCVM